jgi:short-subunit dehydrogenase
VTIDVLVNNAGVVVGKAFVDHSPVDISRTMSINAIAPMNLTRELLPGMLARDDGHVVNVASAAGMVSNPRMSVYCASKWAVIGWSDSLRLELEQARSRVRVTTVTPYYIDTGMFAGVRSVIPLLKPERVADAIVAAIERDAVFLRLPRIIHLLPLVRGILPMRWFDTVVGDWLGVYRSMRTFRGRA